LIVIADACIVDPVIRALKELKFAIVTISELKSERPDYSVMQCCLKNQGILITLDTGIPSQAYAFQYARNGLTVVLLRWKSQNREAWQQMTEIILRDHKYWIEIAEKEPSVISVSYRRGSRTRSWKDISPLISEHAFLKEDIPPDFPQNKQ
jgi:hypothetical protein